MALTNFIDKVTVVSADWLNKVDILKETVFDGAQVKLAAILGLFSANEKFIVNTLTGVSGSNTILGTFALTLRSGQLSVLTPAATNTGATTLNGIAVQSVGGAPCVGGELVINVSVLLLLNSAGTAFIIQNPVNSRLIRNQTKSGSYVFATTDIGTNTIYTGSGGHVFTYPILQDGLSFTLTNEGTGTCTITAGAGLTGGIKWLNGSGALGFGTRTLAIGTKVSCLEALAALEVSGAGLS